MYRLSLNQVINKRHSLYNRCARSNCLTWLSFITVIFQTHLACGSLATQNLSVPQRRSLSVVLSLQTLPSTCPGADPGGVDWVASHPPWVCSVHNSLNTLWFTWTNHSCKQSVWWDANQSLRQSKERIINLFRAKKPNTTACFILFMMVVEHWQLQEHVDWHKANNTP